MELFYTAVAPDRGVDLLFRRCCQYKLTLLQSGGTRSYKFSIVNVYTLGLSMYLEIFQKKQKTKVSNFKRTTEAREFEIVSMGVVLTNSM